MGIQEDLKDAIEAGREDVVRVLAEHRVLPVTVEYESSDLLGGSKTPDFEFQRQYESETGHVADRQTRRLVVDTLGMTSEEECEDVQSEIRNHDDWGAKA
ncbi:hypothetical protein BRD09_01500 [Halobacteriales archaeon SW_10_68_16]|jgi:hypothetical protein|nr:MAG: hypothetical protein BRD09_01500 [Halobacteriales archaeon SW_10_68_16]